MNAFVRWLALVVLAFVALQLFFIGRIAAMTVVDPESTTFQRSEAWRIATQKDKLRWRQQWLAYDRISDNLKRAVIASEDDGFANHDGVDWDALEKAWERNNASRLSTYEAARLAVMLPQPKRFEKNPGSGYLASRASTIAARMRHAELP